MPANRSLPAYCVSIRRFAVCEPPSCKTGSIWSFGYDTAFRPIYLRNPSITGLRKSSFHSLPTFRIYGSMKSIGPRGNCAASGVAVSAPLPPASCNEIEEGSCDREFARDVIISGRAGCYILVVMHVEQ
jgi:hypothetical protein